MNSCVIYSKSRIEKALREIQRLRSIEFPYSDGKEALDSIESVLEEHLDAIHSIDEFTEKNTAFEICSRSLAVLWNLLPFIGFVDRATETGNPFELHPPLLRLVAKILGPRHKLILSSEWDYSPFTYFGDGVLKDFVFVGFPSPEAGNPLLIPLAGHEVGHHLWGELKDCREIESEIEREILSELRDKRLSRYNKFFPFKKDQLEFDFNAKTSWWLSVQWARRQVEETFCDFVGLYLFGTAYLHAFCYLIAPHDRAFRSPAYPPMLDRVGNLKQAATLYDCTCSSHFQDEFVADDNPFYEDSSDRFLLELADDTAKLFVPRAMKLVKTALAERGVTPPDADTVKKIKYAITQFRPCVAARGIQNIVSAGWEIHLDQSIWENHHVAPRKADVLAEILLKNAELAEIETRNAPKQ